MAGKLIAWSGSMKNPGHGALSVWGWRRCAIQENLSGKTGLASRLVAEAIGSGRALGGNPNDIDLLEVAGAQLQQ